MTLLRTLALLILSPLLSACGARVVQADVPALIANPGPETLREIEQTVSAALDGARITLAEDVLTDTSVLVIQRNMQRSIDQPPVLGRDLGRPYRFQLVTDGSQCVLVDRQSGRRWPLTAVECVEEREAD